MNNTAKQCVIGGACALVLGGAMLCADADEATDMIVAVEAERSSVTETYEHANAMSADTDGLIMSFTAIPEYGEDGMAIFRGNDIYVLADIEDYTEGEPITVSGVICEVTDSVIVLTDCVVHSGEGKETGSMIVADAAQTAPDIAYIAPVMQGEDDVSAAPKVYVSSTGKYHSYPACSGMKNYTEMSLEQAVEEGSVACKKCCK